MKNNLMFNNSKKKLNKILMGHYSEFFSLSFIAPLLFIFLLWFYHFKLFDPILIINFYKTYSTSIFGAAASLFGMSLAALSIFISVIYKPALPKMVKSGLLYIFLFPFLLTVILWGILFIIVFVTFFHSMSPVLDSLITYNGIYFSFMLLVFLISICYTIQLSNHVIKTTIISFSKNSE